jgi:oxygen-independent coproporphyrinogen-3 oxidase
MLGSKSISEIIITILERSTSTKVSEITLEANPSNITSEYLQELKMCGVTRISLGIQSFNEDTLRILGRKHTAKESRNASLLAQTFGNFNIDIIYNVLNQSLESFIADLNEALSFKPHHISCYALTIESGTPLGQAVLRGDMERPCNDLGGEMMERAHSLLTGYGYEHYEISNFALAGAYAHHNLNIWRGGEYIGFGSGAHSYFGGKRWANIASYESYIKLLREGKSVVAWSENLSKIREIEDFIMLGLREIRGVNLQSFASRFGKELLNFDEYRVVIEQLIKDDLIVLEYPFLRLSKRGILFADSVTTSLFGVLQ